MWTLSQPKSLEIAPSQSEGASYLGWLVSKCNELVLWQMIISLNICSGVWGSQLKSGIWLWYELWASHTSCKSSCKIGQSQTQFINWFRKFEWTLYSRCLDFTWLTWHLVSVGDMHGSLSKNVPKGRHNYEDISWAHAYDHLTIDKILTLIMNKILIWAPKVMRKMVASTIWIC
jgi:hypothetical protein